MKIIISRRILGRSAVNGQPLPGDALKKLDGVVYDKDVCSNYLANELSDIGLAGGALRITFTNADEGLRLVTEYTSPRKLTAAELRKLAMETQGQWSDGIGEGCFDAYEKQSGVRLDLTPGEIEPDLRIEQVDDGKAKLDPVAKATRQFLRAVKKADVKAAKNALAGGADIEAKSTGFPALHVAIGTSDLEIVRCLIEHGADLNSSNILTGVPLSCCATNNTITDANGAAMAALLLQGGADVNHDNDGWTPLDFAINRGKLALQEVLRAGGGISKYYLKLKSNVPST